MEPDSFPVLGPLAVKCPSAVVERSTGGGRCDQSQGEDGAASANDPASMHWHWDSGLKMLRLPDFALEMCTFSFAAHVCVHSFIRERSPSQQTLKPLL